MEALAFNTAISKLMVFAREIAEEGPPPRDALDAFVRMLAPLAPHLGEELWRKLGHGESVAHAPWPAADPALLEEKTVTLVVQVNGKRRGELVLPAGADDATVEAAALALEPVQRHLAGRAPKKVIVVPGRIVNVVG
jgi:leucyl-tRNA synthetase